MAVSDYSTNRDSNASIAPGNIRSNDPSRDQQIINAIRQLMADMAGFSGQQVGVWTPALTFATPGNLAVTYSNQQGRYRRIGNRCLVHAIIDTSAFTHTTASGEFRIAGLPFTAASITNFQWTGAGEFGNSITLPAGYTQTNINITAGSNFARYVMSGSGVARAAITHTTVVTGLTVSIRFAAEYEIA